jgi:hypothetical protein
MVATVATLHILFLCYFLFGPALRFHQCRQEREAKEDFRNFQAYAVLRFHPAAKDELKNLSISELRRDYNVTEMYNEIGSYL